MMYQLDCSAHSTAQICCLGWGYNFLDVDAVKVNIHKLRGVSNLEDVTNLGSQAKPSDFPDLPTDLAFLDVENMMPKLSTLPAGGQDEFQTSQDLQNRFIRNVDETLQEKCDCTWIHAAYHLVLTGHCLPGVKDWLVDELGERGHKRWEKATGTGYENLRRLTHENLLPSLDRFSVLISRLRGLSRFQDANYALGLFTLELDNILDSVNTLQLMAHNILISTCSELQQFYAFSFWLRQEIENQATDPTSASAQEAAEKDTSVDYGNVLEYIQGAMKESKLLELLGNRDDHRPKWDLDAEGRSLYQLYKKEVSELNKGASAQKQLPGLDDLIAHLDKQCGLVFGRIAETQRRNVRFGPSIQVGQGVPDCMDMRMVSENDSNEEFVIYVALGPTNQRNLVKLFRVLLSLENGVSRTQYRECALIKFGHAYVQDIKFVDDETLMVALVEESCSRLLSINYKPDVLLVYTKIDLGSTDKDGVAWNANEKSIELCVTDLSQQKNALEHTKHVFRSGPSWTPEKLEINGRKGRRAACLLAQDRLHYRQYDLESAATTEAETLQPRTTSDVEMST
ncbi:MAG: hypothetical protein Q9167_000359 [Letrouitia subvulpina]